MKNLLFLITLFIINCSSGDKKVDNYLNKYEEIVKKLESKAINKSSRFTLSEISEINSSNFELLNEANKLKVWDETWSDAQHSRFSDLTLRFAKMLRPGQDKEWAESMIKFIKGFSKVTKDEEPGRFKHGGFVVYEKNGHGLVAATEDLEKMDWDSAKEACANLVLNGYDDWYLPSKEELNQLYLNNPKIGGFERPYYWSSTENDSNYAWAQNFENGGQSPATGKYEKWGVRAVRAF